MPNALNVGTPIRAGLNASRKLRSAPPSGFRAPSVIGETDSLDMLMGAEQVRSPEAMSAQSAGRPRLRE